GLARDVPQAEARGELRLRDRLGERARHGEEIADRLQPMLLQDRAVIGLVLARAGAQLRSLPTCMDNLAQPLAAPTDDVALQAEATRAGVNPKIEKAVAGRFLGRDPKLAEAEQAAGVVFPEPQVVLRIEPRVGELH